MKNTSGFYVTILGNSSAIPTKNHHLSSQLVVYENKFFLVDCGEGTQIQLINYKIKYHKIEHILISHMHGDHFFGLIGLISTFNLLGREKQLHIYGPGSLQQIIENLLEAAHTKLRYDLIFHDLKSKNMIQIYDDNQISIYSFPLNHRIPTWGFKFVEKLKKRRIKKDFVEEFKPSIDEILKIKNGEDYIDSNNQIIPNKTITLTPPTPLSYAYCSDTMYDESIIEYIRNVNLLYHEATFDNSMQKLAQEKFHSTARDAATIAKKSDVGNLILGHFSARYYELNNFLKEAVEVFKPTVLGEEGTEYKVNN